MNIRVNVFANLKDHYDPHFTIDVPPESRVGYLLQRLASEQPESSGTLSSCRIAVGDTLVEKDYLLREDEEIYLLPPSSGG